MNTMKKLVYILLSVALVSMVGCKKQDLDLNTHGGDGLTFLHFDKTSVGATLGASDKTYTYSVDLKITATSKEDRTFNVAIDPSSTGKEGKDFTFTNKTITIPAGSYSGSTSFTCNYAKVDTAGFTLKLLVDVADDMVSPLYGNSVTYTFTTDKVRIDWAWLTGAWTETDIDSKGTVEATYPNVVIKKANDDPADNKIQMFNFWGNGSDFVLNGTVDFTTKTLSLDGGQIFMVHKKYGTVWFAPYDPATGTYDGGHTEPIGGSLTPAGVVINGWVAFCTAGEFGVYNYSTLTR